ncbi:MAG: peptidase M52, partial [Chloroflexi bacterium]|nr:peptidase M52 [Chloroflexota bacterium]
MAVRSLILGLGNAILGDDAVGLRVARAIAERWGKTEGLVVAEEERGGFALLEQLAGFQRAL